MTETMRIGPRELAEKVPSITLREALDKAVKALRTPDEITGFVTTYCEILSVKGDPGMKEQPLKAAVIAIRQDLKERHSEEERARWMPVLDTIEAYDKTIRQIKEAAR